MVSLNPNRDIDTNFNLYIEFMLELGRLKNKKFSQAEVPKKGHNREIEYIADKFDFSVYQNIPSDSEKADVVMIAREGIQSDKTIAELVNEMFRTKSVVPDKHLILINGEGIYGRLVNLEKQNYDNSGNLIIETDGSEYVGIGKNYVKKIKQNIIQKGHVIELLYDLFRKHKSNVVLSSQAEIFQTERRYLESEIKDLLRKHKSNVVLSSQAEIFQTERRFLESEIKERKDNFKEIISEYMENLGWLSNLYYHDFAEHKSDKTIFIGSFEDIALGDFAERLRENKVPYMILVPK